MKKTFFIAFGLCILLLLAFACKSLIEPDIWWQIRTGEWILQNHQVPKVDVLSYTYAGDPWVNIKWLSEVVMFLIAKHTSPEMIYFFLGLLFIPIVFYTFQNYKVLVGHTEMEYSNSFIWAMLVFIVAVSHRINGRPEVFSYFFVATFLFVFLISAKNKYILLTLIPLQVLWCNFHEAYGVGLFMIIAYVAIECIWVENSKRIWLLLILTLCIAGLLLNPIGTKIYGYTLNIFGQLDKNKFTSELLDFTASEYWDLFSLLNLLTFILSSYSIFKLAQSTKWKLKEIHRHIPIYYILITFAFFYLSLKSNRNIPFFQIASLPLYAIALKKLEWAFFQKSKALLYATIILVYLAVVSNQFYSIFDKHNEFGLGVSPKYNPIGATEFLRKEKNQGKVFSDFLCANYPIYHLRPHFKSYIDLRDLDVFPAKFFENCLYLYQAPNRLIAENQTLWEMADSLDKFSYVMLVNQPDFIPLHQELQRGNTFQIVYADANSSLYKRIKGEKSPLSIDSFFHDYSYYPSYPLSNIINKALNPFYKNIEEREYEFEDNKQYYLEEFMQ